MFLLKKIVAAFVLPPGCLVAALFVLGFYLRKKSRAGAVTCAALAAAVWIGSTGVFSDALLRPLESAYSAPEQAEGDVIIMLCGGARGGGAYFSAGEVLSSSSLERASAAALLQKKTGLPLLLSGGRPFSLEPEASSAANYLIERGVPLKAIITESESRDTLENALYSRKLCAAKGFKRVILLTSAYHMPRALRAFKLAGFEAVTPFPVSRISRPGGGRYLRNYLPGSGGDADRAINEYLGLLVYRFY